MFGSSDLDDVQCIKVEYRLMLRSASKFFQYTIVQGDIDNTTFLRTTVYTETGMIITEGVAVSIHDKRGMAQCAVKDNGTLMEVFWRELLDMQQEQWVDQHIQCTRNIGGIIADVEKGAAVGVSDGSFKDNHGTAAWVIENAKGTERIVALIHVPGYPVDQSAYRSEVAGLYGMVRVIKLILDI